MKKLIMVGKGNGEKNGILDGKEKVKRANCCHYKTDKRTMGK